MSTLFILAGHYQKPVIGPGQIIFAVLFLLAFVFILFWAFRKDKNVTLTHFGNSGILALTIGGAIILLILVKIILHQAQ